MEAVSGCDAIVIVTEWDEFNTYDYKKIEEKMRYGKENETGNANIKSLGFYDLRSYIDLKRVKLQTKFDRIFRLGNGYIS